MATVTITRSTGYTGRTARPSYVARITGTTRNGKLEREFVEGTPDDSNEMFRARKKGKGTWDETVTIDEPGIYEIVQWGEATLRLYVDSAKTPGAVVPCSASCPDADELARLIDLAGGADEAFGAWIQAREAARAADPASVKLVDFAAAVEAARATEAE